MRHNLGRLYALLGERERRRVRRLLALLVVVAFFETLGVLSIMPFLALVANPSLVARNRLLSGISALLGLASPQAFLLAAGAGTLLALALSNTLSALASWFTHRVVYQQEHLLSLRLLSRYADKPYAFFHEHNTAELIKNILSEVNLVIQGVMLPLLQLAAKSLVALFLIALLVAADPRLAFSLVAALGGAYALIYAFAHRALARIGERRTAANGARFKAASQLLGGIREVKLYGRGGYFLRGFDAAADDLAHAWTTTQAIAQLPRYALEVLAFGGIILIVLYLLATRGALGDALPLVGLYALAGYRLMPAFQQIFSALTSLRFHDAALETLLRDAGGDAPPATGRSVAVQEAAALTEGIEIRDLSYRYGAGREPALVQVNLTIASRSCVGLIGPTGSGKSTLLDLIAGLLQPQTGEILIDGKPLGEDNRLAWQRTFGYVPQQIFLIDDTITRNIAFGLPDDEIDMARVRRAAAAARLEEFVQRELPQGYETVVGERGIRLPGGERQRIGIARALYRDPEILVFDEATAALDNLTEAALMQAVRDLSGHKTLILVAHRLATVRQCDRVFLLEGGRIAAAGRFDELMQSNADFRAMALAPAPGSAPQAS